MKRSFFTKLILLVISMIVSACANSNGDGLPADSPDGDLPAVSKEDPGDFEIEDSEGASEMADVVFTNGVLLSMTQGGEVHEGIAIKANRILAVGETNDIEPYIAESTQIIDLGGRTLMPGFIDTHQHLFDDGIIQGYDPLPNQQVAIEAGITSIADMYVDEKVLSQLVGFSSSGELRVRLNAYLVYTNNCGDVIGDWWKAYQPSQILGPNLQIGGIKIFTDGGSCNIPAMSVEYPGGGFGDLFFAQEDLTRMIREVNDAGFQTAIHALGDRSLEEVLNAIEEALGGEENTLRHRIEHNSTIRPDLLTRYNETGAIPIIFGAYPTCIRTEGGGKFKYVLSSDYGEWEWPWRALMDSNPGIKPAWHSDFLAFPNMSPLYHAWGMVTRKSIAEDGSICEPPDWLEAGALNIEEVLPMMTINAAYAIHSENEIGSLEAGKLADMVVLSDNPLEVAADDLKDIQVLMTMIDGKVEYCADPSICPNEVAKEPGSESTSSVSMSASTSLPENPPDLAMDGNSDTVWNSGQHAEQWIQIDLGAERQISSIRLLVSQYPGGDTIHQIWAGRSETDLSMKYEFKGFSADEQTVEFNPSEVLENIRIIRIVTTESPSWIAWREIEIN